MVGKDKSVIYFSAVIALNTIYYRLFPFLEIHLFIYLFSPRDWRAAPAPTATHRPSDRSSLLPRIRSPALPALHGRSSITIPMAISFIRTSDHNPALLSFIILVCYPTGEKSSIHVWVFPTRFVCPSSTTQRPSQTGRREPRKSRPGRAKVWDLASLGTRSRRSTCDDVNFSAASRPSSRNSLAHTPHIPIRRRQ